MGDLGVAAARTVRVASVPATHVYVRHLSRPDGPDPVVRLADPRHCAAPGGSPHWWPPVMLDPGWVREHAASFDVFHLHFGFDAHAPDGLREVVAALRDLGKPLVQTVHDLVNPHHASHERHLAQLDVLIPAADRLVTLTHGAARRVAERWGREALVLPHPHVVGPARLSEPRRRHDGFVVGVHLKSLRANMAPVPVLRVLAETMADWPDAVLRVDAHPDLDDPRARHGARRVMAEVRRLERAGRLRLHVHPYFDDAQLWDYLGGLDVSVLPYRHGTHSGWLEACHDLGTTVLAPSCGFYAEQRPCLVYRHDHRGLDDRSLRSALTTAYERRPLWRADRAERRAERLRLSAAHHALYAALL